MASRYNQAMGAKLKALRSLRHVHRTDCARYAGIHPRTWFRWEQRLPTKRITTAFKAVASSEQKALGGHQLHMGL